MKYACGKLCVCYMNVHYVFLFDDAHVKPRDVLLCTDFHLLSGCYPLTLLAQKSVVG